MKPANTIFGDGSWATLSNARCFCLSEHHVIVLPPRHGDGQPIAHRETCATIAETLAERPFSNIEPDVGTTTVGVADPTAMSAQTLPMRKDITDSKRSAEMQQQPAPRGDLPRGNPMPTEALLSIDPATFTWHVSNELHRHTARV